ncbi:MAG: transglutaminase family protein [Chromatiales bacterium]|nr:transglutaminase family protein [Chromatiales bacterium]
MSIQVALRHRTEYRYDRRVGLSPQLIRLRPAPHTRTPLHRYALTIEPAGHFLNWQQDPFGNFVARVVFPDPVEQFVVDVDLVADLVTINPFDFFVEPEAEAWPFDYERHLAHELAPYFEIREHGPRLERWLARVPRKPTQIVSFLVDLNQRLQQDIGYLIRLEPGIQTCEETLELARGSCRDSAWLLVQILRHLGLAARFVSGYLVQLAPDQKSLDGPSGAEADFTDLHAWAEVFVPGAGWIGLDPTSGLFAGEGHIPLACTPDPQSAAPVEGASDPCEVEFHYINRVTRIKEKPRTTKPYGAAQWHAIRALGETVDARLERAGVRLTMGGEPTFVSIDDMDSPQWTTAALGAHKLERAEALLRRLHARFADGGSLHQAQGKWYPGEPLPRWSLDCVWRNDGLPVWRNPALLAAPESRSNPDTAIAGRFARALASRLGLSEDFVAPGYEDAFYYLWKEGTLPDNLNPKDNRLANPLERARLREVFEHGLDHTVGYALPLVFDGGWQSGPWRFRRNHMFLLPGNSPMGLRLPLDALPWEAPARRQQWLERDPFAPEPSIADLTPRVQDPNRARFAGNAAAESLVRTALCVEPRDGRLHVFMPPLATADAWLGLMQAIEQVAATLHQPVVLEGYEAPHDSRLSRFHITPDPGVIEVNIHPAHNWDELVTRTEALYEEARLARLGTEKFNLDGRHTGTGGGNHVTIGAAMPADSPILRRPDLLSSLVLYWQHHPGLSYLFSGAFIGPTSQAPRIDEARDAQMHEFEIALEQTPAGEIAQPWLVDRLYRNLLVDLTGNTHRSEFCIDKLYSPDGPTGRRGLVEFRAFEMPPHAQMSAVQMLLLRSLIARFWAQPYTGRPVRWGTELHDRFLLPHYVERDVHEVVDDLRRFGIAFDPHWIDPFVEFRFPKYGAVSINDVELELRFAIEPWHVLGEEMSSGGTARFVDSSIERVQMRATGITEGRHVVTCNGRRVPLHPTGRRAESVAGVRFKAWAPYSAMHPTIGRTDRLVFDLHDTWNRRSLGGCTYFVAHPAGRNYESFPVNANEAEARRQARFAEHGHTPGEWSPPPERPSEDFPYTLDLRRRPR